MTSVHFIGAGPGDPELITLKGARLIAGADVIIYAGSLVNPAVLAGRKAGAVVHDSAGMNLEQVIAVMRDAVADGRLVVRVHSGDPSLYGAIREQIDRLEEAGIVCDVVPGVSSFAAAAAALKREYTLPGISQSLICTRLAGRTPVPEGEELSLLAAHRASMAIFLSTHLIESVVERLRVHYPAETPVAMVHRASWPDQFVIMGTLADIAAKAQAASLSRQALILVGDFLGDRYELSKLYDRHFAHGCREAAWDGE